MKCRIIQCVITMVSLLGSLRTDAQWISQRISLRSGWNAVFLHVQPDAGEPGVVFAGLPRDSSVWNWNRRFNPVQFIQNADELRPGDPDWLFYSHSSVAGIPQSAMGLRWVRGGTAYLIKVPSAVELVVKGKPVLRPPGWVPNSMNLMGFQVVDSTAPTFAGFFAPSPEHKANAVFRLAADGTWRQEVNTTTERLQANEAFWIQTSGASTYSGPLEASVSQTDRLDFGLSGVELQVRVRNRGLDDRAVVIQPLPSEEPPSGATRIAGIVPLARWRTDIPGQIYGWDPLNSEANLGTLKPGETIVVRLAVKRELLQASQQGGSGTRQYQSLLRISDTGRGQSIFIPVTASSGLPLARGAALATQQAPAEASVGTGLWIGDAIVEKVSEPASVSDPDVPRSVANPASFRLIVHVDSRGNARLLQQVYMMFQTGKTNANGQVVQPGETVLISDDSLLAGLSGSTLRDGQSTGRRFSSVAFGFDRPYLEMEGPFGSQSQNLNCSYRMSFDHPLNPFKHRYHPDHNNLSEDYREVVPEAYDLERQIALSFQSIDPFGRDIPEYGTKALGGIYREVIRGVHRRAIFVEGRFFLRKASTVAVLNGGL